MSVSIFKKSLKRYIETYNRYIVSLGSDYNLDLHETFYIPINNQKMYCIVLNNTIYFFTRNGNSDFFIHLRNVFKEDMLLEGYMYDESMYLITDILMTNGKVVDKNYTDRYNILFNFDYSKLNNLNNKITVKIHDIYTEFPESKVTYHRSFVEQITNTIKVNERVFDFDSEIVKKLVKKGKYSDVYLVYNIDTNDPEGILYVKTLKMSRDLRIFYERDEESIINCKYNLKFKKFEPIEF